MKYLEIFGRNFILIIIAAIAIYSIFLVVSDINLVYDTLSNFDWKFFPLILIIIFCSWLILFVRWEIILRSYKIRLPVKDNLLIYLAGSTFAITPVKSGELIKSVLSFGIGNAKKSASDWSVSAGTNSPLIVPRFNNSLILQKVVIFLIPCSEKIS